MRNPTLRANLASALRRFLGKEVRIKIRLYKTHLTGVLNAFDQYSNLLIGAAKEFKTDPETGEVQLVQEYPNGILIRGDSIVHVEQNKEEKE